MNLGLMDIWDKKKRSAVMAKIKSKDTKPELLVRRYLYARGYRYRKNVKGLPGTPDIVLKKYGVVVFINGCFWHGHKTDGNLPRSNSEFWQKKIERNQARDEKNKQALLAMGWKVITIWECQLKHSLKEKTLFELEYYINRSFLERYRTGNPTPYGTGEESFYLNVAAPSATYAVAPETPEDQPSEAASSDTSVSS